MPMGLPPGTKIADKTGDIGTAIGDAGIVTANSGKKYIVAIAVERPFNDRRANLLVRQISKDVYLGVTGDVEGIKTLEAMQAKWAVAPHTVHHGRRHHRKQTVQTTSK